MKINSLIKSYKGFLKDLEPKKKPLQEKYLYVQDEVTKDYLKKLGFDQVPSRGSQYQKYTSKSGVNIDVKETGSNNLEISGIYKGGWDLGHAEYFLEIKEEKMGKKNGVFGDTVDWLNLDKSPEIQKYLEGTGNKIWLERMKDVVSSLTSKGAGRTDSTISHITIDPLWPSKGKFQFTRDVDGKRFSVLLKGNKIVTESKMGKLKEPLVEKEISMDKLYSLGYKVDSDEKKNLWTASKGSETIKLSLTNKGRGNTNIFMVKESVDKPELSIGDIIQFHTSQVRDAYGRVFVIKAESLWKVIAKDSQIYGIESNGEMRAIPRSSADSPSVFGKLFCVVDHEDVPVSGIVEGLNKKQVQTLIDKGYKFIIEFDSKSDIEPLSAKSMKDATELMRTSYKDEKNYKIIPIQDYLKNLSESRGITESFFGNSQGKALKEIYDQFDGEIEDAVDAFVTKNKTKPVSELTELVVKEFNFDPKDKKRVSEYVSGALKIFEESNKDALDSYWKNSVSGTIAKDIVSGDEEKKVMKLMEPYLKGTSASMQKIKGTDTIRVWGQNGNKYVVDIVKQMVVKEGLESGSFSEQEAIAIGNKLGIDFNKIPLEQFLKGLNHELEHSAVLDSDEEVGQTAKDHLDEIPDYYEGLSNMEKQYKVKSLDESVSIPFPIGSVWIISDKIFTNKNISLQRDWANIPMKVMDIKPDYPRGTSYQSEGLLIFLMPDDGKYYQRNTWAILEDEMMKKYGKYVVRGLDEGWFNKPKNVPLQAGTYYQDDEGNYAFVKTVLNGKAMGNTRWYDSYYTNQEITGTFWKPASDIPASVKSKLER